MHFTTGQRMRILRRMHQVAEERGLRDILPVIDQALRHEQTVRGMENRWAGNAGSARYSDQVSELDTLVDQLLAGLRDVVKGHARGLAVDDPVAVMCDDFLSELFPHGLVAIISLPYVDQVTAVDVILGKLSGELADSVRHFSLEQKRDRLIELNAEYRRLIDEGRQGVRFPEVRDARERSHELLREIVAVVLGRFRDSTDPDQVAIREALLAPLMVQLDETIALGKARRRNRNVPVDEVTDDIDDTDDDVTDDTDDTDDDVTDDTDDDVTDDEVTDEGTTETAEERDLAEDDDVRRSA